MCRVKVVDLYTEVVTLGCGVLALNEVQLLSTDAQPAYREGEAWSGDLPHPEKVFVEVHRLVEVVGVDAYVGRGSHELPISPVPSLFLPRYRTSFSLAFPSMEMLVFCLVAVLMVVTLIGLLLWFFFLRGS
jgi:hypothetical protein